MIKYAHIIKDLPENTPFVGPETQERELGYSFAARLGANESIFGPSKAALRVMRHETRSIWKYGDPENYELKKEIALKHNISTDNIVVGEGIDGLLGYLTRLLISPGENVVTTDGAYPTFNYHVSSTGGRLHLVQFQDNRENLEGLLAATKKNKAKIVYCSNPNNPMGTMNQPHNIENFALSIPETSLLCLDEAYCDYLSQNLIPKIPVDTPNVIRLRTFSKAYGLAGARCGYAIGPTHLVRAFNKIRNHFGVNRIAQLAAIASLRDHTHIPRIQKKVGVAIKKLSSIAIENKCIPIPSYTNFLAVDCLRDETFARKVVIGLAKKKIFVRMPFSFPQNRCIRVSAGNAADIRLFSEAFEKVLNELK